MEKKSLLSVAQLNAIKVQLLSFIMEGLYNGWNFPQRVFNALSPQLTQK